MAFPRAPLPNEIFLLLSSPSLSLSADMSSSDVGAGGSATEECSSSSSLASLSSDSSSLSFFLRLLVGRLSDVRTSVIRYRLAAHLDFATAGALLFLA